MKIKGGWLKIKNPGKYLAAAVVICVAIAAAFFISKPEASTRTTTPPPTCALLASDYKTHLMTAWNGIPAYKEAGKQSDGIYAYSKYVLKKNLDSGGTYEIYDMYSSLSEIAKMETLCLKDPNTVFTPDDQTLISGLADIMLVAGPNPGAPAISSYPTKTDAGHWQWGCNAPQAEGKYAANDNGCDLYYGGYQNKEVLLRSSQFVDLASMVAHAIALVPNSQRTPSMKQFATVMGPILVDHYDKWLTACTSNCSGNSNQSDIVNKQFGYDPNFSIYLRARLGSSYDQVLHDIDITDPNNVAKNEAQAKVNDSVYAYAVDDKQMLIADGAVEMQAASKVVDGTHSALFPLTNPITGNNISASMTAFIGNEAKLLKNRAYTTTLKDFAGNNATGMDFDKGVWKYFYYSPYADYANETMPTTATPYERGIDGPSWDVTHASTRWNYLLTDLYENNAASFPTKTDLDNLANEVAYSAPQRKLKQLDGTTYTFSFAQPIFSNYVNGLRGWFMQDGMNLAPGAKSISMLTGWGQLAKYGNVSKITGGVANISGLNNISNFDSLPDLQKLKLASLSLLGRANLAIVLPNPLSNSDCKFLSSYYVSAGVKCNLLNSSILNGQIYANLLYLPPVNIGSSPAPTPSPSVSPTPIVTPTVFPSPTPTASTCTRKVPTVTVAPAGQTTGTVILGGTASYTVTVTSNDTPACSAAQFTLTTTGLPATDTTVFSPMSALAPGAIGHSTLIINVGNALSPVNFTVSATNTGVTGVSTAGALTKSFLGLVIGVTRVRAADALTGVSSPINLVVSQTPVPQCTHKQPSVYIVSESPNNGSGTLGSTVQYTIIVTNNDTLGCTKSTYSLAATGLPSGDTATFTTMAAFVPGVNQHSTLKINVTNRVSPVNFKVQATGNNLTGTSTPGSLVVQVTPTPTPTCAGVIAYANGNYGGRQTCFIPGNYANLVTFGINDSISSVKVAPGFKVVAYQNASYGGKSLNILADTPNLANINMTSNFFYSTSWNDQMSSLVVSQVAVVAPVVNTSAQGALTINIISPTTNAFIPSNYPNVTITVKDTLAGHTLKSAQLYYTAKANTGVWTPYLLKGSIDLSSCAPRVACTKTIPIPGSTFMSNVLAHSFAVRVYDQYGVTNYATVQFSVR